MKAKKIITTSELRIGNFVMQHDYAIGNRQIEVCELDSSQVNYLDQSYCEGIELTKDWLLKFGFELDVVGEWFEKNDFGIKSDLSRFVWTTTTNDEEQEENYQELPACNYVHQLQNLFFAITGQELEITEEKSAEL